LELNPVKIGQELQAFLEEWDLGLDLNPKEALAELSNELNNGKEAQIQTSAKMNDLYYRWERSRSYDDAMNALLLRELVPNIQKGVRG
jgi:hypothetical protein